jgi:hypothetical protein
MKNLIRKILKEESLKQTIMDYIPELGVLETIKMIGGFDIFNEILPNYFDSNEHKIDLINQLVNDNDPGNYIYFYEILGDDISLGNVDSYNSDNDHTYEEFITAVTDGSVKVMVYEFDEDGNMLDDVFDDYLVPLRRLPDHILEKVFEPLVTAFL